MHLLPGNTLGIPVQHARPVEQGANDSVTDCEVVVDQIQLGLAPGREIHPFRTRYAHDAVAHGDLDRLAVRASCHPPTVGDGPDTR